MRTEVQIINGDPNIHSGNRGALNQILRLHRIGWWSYLSAFALGYLSRTAWEHWEVYEWLRIALSHC